MRALLVSALSCITLACGPATRVSSDTRAPRETVLRLTHAAGSSAEKIYVQAGGWFSARGPDGERIGLVPACEYAFCGQTCAICGAAPAHVTPLSRGDSVEFVWNGKQYVLQASRDCQAQCQVEEDMPQGPATFVFCHGTAFSGEAPSQWLTGVTCADELIEFPTTEGLIEHIVSR